MRFIVGYTSTPTGRDALALGARLAKAADAQLDLVLVLGRSEAVGTADYQAKLHATAEGWLAEAAATVPGDVRIQTHLIDAESFAEGLLDASRELEARFLVIGAAHGGLLGRVSTGSVAGALLHSAEVPVVLAPSGWASRPYAMTVPISRVSCAIGTRSGAQHLLEEAIGVTRRLGAPLRLLSLVALDRAGSVAPPEAVEAGREHAESLLAAATEVLPADIEVSTEVAAAPGVEAAVASIDWDPDEVVLLGSSRLASPKRLFLGATAAQMLRELPVPVVVVPSAPAK
ncbi:universal stress protein [Schumannella sp. 10F1B-5-1]|uniref:universal stress protein n=1 Tax=Schumannella sp. 10F1B-5-1 TaxID=2590780 RepID=UPI001131C46A|nr:universal stress protein [Schumannella sp. 10F1B-5-1]TPW76952.1 universal stress protein [Schumannella sp. 10F1B-5-1]